MSLVPTIRLVVRRAARIISVVSVSLMLLAFCATLTVLGSEGGTRWSLQFAKKFAPELAIEQISGTWLEGLHSDSLRWRDTDSDITLRDINVRIRWSALLHGQLKLLPLNAQQLSISIISPSNETPVQLPHLFLPFSLLAPELSLQQLTIVNGDSTVTLNNLHGNAHWAGTTLRLRQTQLSWEEMRLNAAGTLHFRGDYPLQLQGELRTPQLEAPIKVSTKGDLRRLQLSIDTTQPLAAHADVTLATLDTHLPLSAHITLTQPDTVLQPELPLTAHSGTLDLTGDLRRVDGALTLAINEPHYGDSKIAATLQWLPDQLHANTQLILPSGDLQSECSLALTEPIAWQCSGTANAIPLTPWLPNIDGTLSGPINLTGAWRAPQLSLALDLPALSGKLGTDIITGQLQLRTNDGTQWQLPKLLLNAGPNQLQANGQFGTHNHLQLALNAPNLAHLRADLAGSLNATLSADGDWPQPNLRAQLRGNRLRYQTTTLERADIALTLAQLGLGNSVAHIELQQLASDSQTPFDITLSTRGTRTQQRSALNLRQQQSRANLTCSTNASSDFQDWQFNCDTLQAALRIAHHSSDWHNNAALRGAWQGSKQQFELVPFCLRAESAALCLDNALRINQQQLQSFAVHGDNLPVNWLSVWLPENLKLDNDAHANLQMNLTSATPLQLQATLKVAHTQWSWPIANKKQTAAIDDIAFVLQLDEQRALFSGAAHSPTIGAIAAQLTVLDPRGQRNLDGNIAVQHIELAGLAWLVEGIEGLVGQINGNVQLKGSTAAPQLYGQLLLQDGAANWSALGAPFRNVHINLDFDNNSAKLGGWFALGEGGGDIDGSVRWDSSGADWHAQLSLIAGGISASPFPQSTILFSPHITLTAAPDEVKANGFIDIAKAELFLKELPPQTIDVSPDAHIVGQQAPVDDWKIWADIGLNLGEQFHFRGLGADVNLTGRLRLQQQPGAAPNATGEVRVPRGRYRAYGQRLSVRSGSFIFNGPWDNPDLHLEAIRELPPGTTDVVGIRVLGSLKSPEAILFSEPSLPDSEIAYYLLTGRKPSPTGNASNSSFSAGGALLSLGLAGGEDHAAKLAEKFGITDLQVGTTQNTKGSEAELSGQLSQDLYVRYGRGLDQGNSSITFQYKLTPRLMIETISGVENALDLFYKFDVK